MAPQEITGEVEMRRCPVDSEDRGPRTISDVLRGDGIEKL